MMSSKYPRPLDTTQANETSKFEYPPLLSIVNPRHATELKSFAWNYQSEADQNATFLTVEHEYISRCYLLTPFLPLQLTFAGLYLASAVAWIVCVFYLWKHG